MTVIQSTEKIVGVALLNKTRAGDWLSWTTNSAELGVAEVVENNTD